MVFAWGTKLDGEVQNAKDVFVVRTAFTHGYGITLLPDRSYLCLLEDMPVRRRVKMEAGIDTGVLDYAEAKSRRGKTVRAYFPIAMQWKSVFHAYLLPAAIALLVVALFSGIIYLEEHWPKALALTIICPILSGGLLLMRMNRFDLNYEQAAKLAVMARVDESVIEEIQTAYGRCPDCAIIHGRPVSSRRVLYLYVDGDVDSPTASRVFKKLRKFAYSRSWEFGEIWPINTASTVDGEVSRELGLVAALSQERVHSREDIIAIVQMAATLKARFGLNFALGAYDTESRSNQDLFMVDSPQPGLARLEVSLKQIEKIMAQTPAAR